MSFHEVLFPAALSFGSSGGPERRTEVITLASGFEERNTTWAHSRRSYDAGIGLRSADDIHELIAFYEARLGKLYGFRWMDWSDHRSGEPSQSVTAMDQPLGIGDGVTSAFNLTKTYASGPASYVRPISKPVEESVLIAVDGVELTSGSDFTLDATTGVVSLDAIPAVGVSLTAGFKFHVPVRFDTDRIEVNLATFEAGEIPSILITEVRV